MKRSRGFRESAADGATIVVGLCAVVLTASVLRDKLIAPVGPRGEDREVAGWEQHAQGGNRIGPAAPTVTIIEFGDYECPFCQRLEPVLRALIKAYPEDVALVYRHFALSYHRHAYAASRIAECAAEQGRFRSVHQLIYDTPDLSTLDARRITGVVEMRDPVGFISCAERTGRVSRIEEDMALAEELKISVTPTLLVNGRLLGSTPDSARMFDLVRRALGEKGRS